LIVVGSGPAGLAAAEAFRRRDSTAPIRLLTSDGELPYARPPLSKEYLRGDAEKSDALLHPPDWFDERAITVVTGAAVESIDTTGRTVTAAGTTHPYRWLVLACGARPAPPPMPGAKSALQLRSLAEAATLREAAGRAESAVVIGAGFIGCEAAASMAMRGVPSTLVAPDPVPQAKRLGHKAGQRIADLIAASGARYVGNVAVDAVEDGAVRLSNGVTIDCDLVLAATGVHPQSGVAVAAGLRIADGRIVVDAGMRTSVEGIYAAGDVALAHNTTAGRRVATEHWQDATDQGAIAGAVAAGQAEEWDGVPGFWTTIGDATLKYHAWGDGYDGAHFVGNDDGFTVWYHKDGIVVGVLTHNADDDYDAGERLVAEKRPIEDVVG
jgi:3-phenylpropionate/trans-cinnamate dioxygenase ferredoxin reductase component